MTPGKNKEKDMKKILLSFLAVFLIGALVISCDSNAKNIGDETATVSFATSMGRTLSSSVTYTDFSQLNWRYQAIPAQGAKFTHGQTNGWVDLTSLDATVELSQGFWTFKLQARNGDEVVFEGNKANVLIKKQATPFPVEINVSPVAGGNGSIVLSGITIKGIDNTEANPVSYNANKAVITNKDDDSDVFNLNLGTSSVTQQVSAGNYSVTVSFEENGLVYGIETLDITVYSGSTVTISGYISEDSQSITLNPSLQDAPVTTFAKQLPVDQITDNNSKAIVNASSEESGMVTIRNKDLVVSYPNGTPIVEANADNASKTADAKTGFVYKGNTLSSASGSVSVSSSESVAQYELTLNVSQENSSVYVIVEKVIDRNLVITKVLHSGKELTKTSNAPASVVTDTEYYSYSESDGKLTLYVFHASPIDIITASLPTVASDCYLINTKEDLVVFEEAVNKGGNTFSGKTIKLTDDIDLSGVTWNPIGQTGVTQFQGVFDGQGHTISNMTVNNPSESENISSGFFGWIEDHGQGIKVQNVKFSNASVTGSHYVGVVAGYLYGTINNCTVENSTVIGLEMNEDANGDKVGGIVGYVGEDAFVDNNTVKNSYITGNRDIGGIAGAIAKGVDSFTYNEVSDTRIKYVTVKEYQSAGAIVSGRTGYTPDSTNTATNVSVNKVTSLVSTLDELEAAVGNLHDGDYIAFGANIVQNKVDTTSGQITFAKASDATTDSVKATLDLNGFVFDGQIGGFSYSNNDLTMIIHGTEKAVADYYEHETGHHMVKACAVFLYTGSYEIKDGLFKSNNATIFSYGGEITIDGGEFVQTSNGVVIGACNDGSTTINGGKFKVEGSEGALFSLETFRENEYPVLTINDGEFTTVGTNSYCFVIEKGNGPKCKIEINGGTFNLTNQNGLATYESDSSTSEEELNLMIKNSISIKGGTFNVDPSTYVPKVGYKVTNNGDGTWTVTAE